MKLFHYPPYVMLCQVFKLLVENNKRPNFEWRREGWVWIVLFFEAINPIQGQFNVSTIWSPIVAIEVLTDRMQFITFSSPLWIQPVVLLTADLCHCMEFSQEWQYQSTLCFYSKNSLLVMPICSSNKQIKAGLAPKDE